MSKSLLAKLEETGPKCPHLAAVRRVQADAVTQQAAIDTILQSPDLLKAQADAAWGEFAATHDPLKFEEYARLHRDAASREASVYMLRQCASGIRPIALRDCGKPAIAALKSAIARIDKQIQTIDASERSTAEALNLDYQPGPNIHRLTEFKGRLAIELTGFVNSPSSDHADRFSNLKALLPLDEA